MPRDDRSPAPGRSAGARPPSRRTFLTRTAAFGLLAASAAALGPSRPAALAAPSRPRRVLIEDLVDPGSQRLAARGAVGARPASGVLAAQRPFTHVGVHWTGPDDVPVDVSTSADGLAWSPWQRVVVEQPATASLRAGETFGALVGAARHRQVRFRLAGGADRIGDLTVTCLNSLDGPLLGPALGSPDGRLAWLGAEVAFADGADFRTGIMTREQWGADESIRFDARTGAELWERAYVAPRMVVVHHTATVTDYADAAAEIRAIYAYNAVTEGFGDIAYNALIDREGNIYEGRRGRDEDPFGRLDRDVLSYGVVAGHALDYNYGSVGIALLGNYQEPGSEPTEAMLRRLEDLLAFEHGRHQVDPRPAIDFVRSTRLWRYDLQGLSGHRDCNNTDCPGDAVYRRLDGLRAGVAERLEAGPVVRSIAEMPSDRNPWTGSVAAYVWSGTPPYDCVFEGFQRPIGQDPADPITGYDGRDLPEHVVTAQRAAAFTLAEPGQYSLHLRPAGTPFADLRSVLADRHAIRDNADPEGVERTGPWTRSRNVLQFYGSDYEYAEEGSGARFAWTLAVPEAGRYTVQACWAAASDRSTAARYRFGAEGAPPRAATADQTRNGGVWVNFGEVALEAERSCRVELEASAGGVVIADAVRLLAAD